MAKVLKAGESNAQAWGLPGVLDFFATNRCAESHIYPSERFFLMDRLKDGMTILDVGCAQGGFAHIVESRIRNFYYTGLDINAEMITRARTRHPRHRFHHVPEGDYRVLGGAKFDLVLVLGILHLHEAWRETLAGAWAHTGDSLIFDLRQIDGPTIEDRERSYMRMNFAGENNIAERVPYVLVNAAEAQRTVLELCGGAHAIAQYGYRHPITVHAISPAREVMTTTWCVER